MLLDVDHGVHDRDDQGEVDDRRERGEDDLE